MMMTMFLISPPPTRSQYPSLLSTPNTTPINKLHYHRHHQNHHHHQHHYHHHHHCSQNSNCQFNHKPHIVKHQNSVLHKTNQNNAGYSFAAINKGLVRYSDPVFGFNQGLPVLNCNHLAAVFENGFHD